MIQTPIPYKRSPSTVHNTRNIARYIIGIIVIAILIKLWLVGAHDILVKNRPHDDLLFIKLAQNILNGEWLGDFNNKTLIKGPGFPLFIAISYWLGIPLLLAQQLLYVAASLLTLLALKPLTRNHGLLLLVFLLILFNPFTFNYPAVGRIFRESIYLSLALMCMASMLGLWVYTRKSKLLKYIWSILLAVSLSFLWITREETIWLVPGFILFGLLYVPPWQWNVNSSLQARLVAYLIPVFSVFITVSAITHLNQQHYQVKVYNELKSPEFVSALGGLMNIKPQEFKKHTPVSQATLKQALEVSPALRELEPYISAKSHWPRSYFLWKLMSSARHAGYYTMPDDARDTFDLYRRIGEEIAQACDNQRLDCYDRKVTLRPPWVQQYNKEILPVFMDITSHAIGFDLMNTYSDEFTSRSDSNMLLGFDYITGEHAFRLHKNFKSKTPLFHTRMIRFKEWVLSRIAKIYRYLVPLLFILALFFHAKKLIADLRNPPGHFTTWFGLVLFGSIFSVLVVLSFVKITLWGIERPLHVIYPLVLLYIAYILSIRSEKHDLE